MRPTLIAPGTKRFKLKYDVPLSNFAFKFNSRRYIMGILAKFSGVISSIPDCVIGGMTTFLFANVLVGPGRYCSPHHRHAF